MGLTPRQIVTEFSFGQIAAMTETKRRERLPADPTALRPGEKIISPGELQEIIERRKQRAAAKATH